jgi:histidine triad (HIT) family protein
VAQNDGAVAFPDLNPQAPTHVLIIPRDHVDSVAAFGDGHSDLAAQLLSLAAEIGAGLEGGWRLVTNVGPDAGQSVFHLHFHLLGGRHLGWPPG